MRSLVRNRQIIRYAVYQGREEITDSSDRKTGEYRFNYGVPVTTSINVSAARGEASTRQFGDLESYDKVLVTNDLHVPITESTILWIDNIENNADQKTWNDILDVDLSEISFLKWYELAARPHDYIVKKIARSLNSVAIAVKKVSVGD